MMCPFFLISNFIVLLISDAKIAFDAFRNGMAATVFSKTVITVNPGEKALHTTAHSVSMVANGSLVALTDTREASQLFSYVKQAAESGALDLDERAEDVTGGCHNVYISKQSETCNFYLYSKRFV